MTVRHRRHGILRANHLLLASLFISMLWSLVPHGVKAQDDADIQSGTTEPATEEPANALQATEPPAAPDDSAGNMPEETTGAASAPEPSPPSPTTAIDPNTEPTVASGPSPPGDDDATAPEQSPGETPTSPAANEIAAPLEVRQQATEDGETSFSEVTISPPTSCTVSEPVTGTLLLNNPPSGSDDIFDGIFVTLFGRNATTAAIVQLGSTGLSTSQDEGLHFWDLVGDFSTTYDQWHITVSLVAHGVGPVQTETFPVVPTCGSTEPPPPVLAAFEIVEIVPPPRCTETIAFTGIVNLRNAGAAVPGSVHIQFIGVTPTGNEIVHAASLIPGSFPDGNHAFTSLLIDPFNSVSWILRFDLRDINETVIQSETRTFDLDCTEEDSEETSVGNVAIEPVTTCAANTTVRGTINVLFGLPTDYAVILQIQARDIRSGSQELLGEPIRLAQPEATTGTNAWAIAGIDFSDRYDQWELLVFESGSGFDDTIAELVVSIPVNCAAVDPTEPGTPPDPTVVDPIATEPAIVPATQAPPTSQAPVVEATESTAEPPVSGLPSAGAPQHQAQFPLHLALTAVLLLAAGTLLRIRSTVRVR